MPTSNSDFFVKYGLNVGNTATIANNTTIGGSLTVANTITTNDPATTHSIQGNVAFSTDLLYIERAGRKVGINGVPTDDTFKVVGTANVTIDSRVGRNLSVGANVAVTRDLSVAGDTSVQKLTAAATTVSSLNCGGNIVMAPGAKVDGVDISELELQISAISNEKLLRVYDVNNTLIFPSS